MGLAGHTAVWGKIVDPPGAHRITVTSPYAYSKLSTNCVLDFLESLTTPKAPDDGV